MSRFNKSLLGKICVALFVGSGAISAQLLGGNIPKMEPIENKPVGMGLRIQQRTVEEFMKSMQEFLPHFVTYDLDLEKHQKWDFSLLFGLLKYEMIFENIKFDQPTFDMLDTRVAFDDTFGRQMLKVGCPAIKKWKIEADTNINFAILPNDSYMIFDFEDMVVKFNTEFETLPTGFLRPVIWATDLKWGESKIYHENWFAMIMLDQTVKLTMIVIQNSLYFLGDYIMNGMIEPPMTQLANYYQFPVHLPQAFNGQEASADFMLDFRHHPNRNPEVGNGYMDLFVLGELSYEGDACAGMIKDNNIHFINSQEQSQLVLGESTANCIAMQVMKSDLGKLHFNTEKFN